MAAYDFAPQTLLTSANTARTDLLNLVPGVQRIDAYAGTKLKSTVDPLRTTVDGIKQSQMETCRELKIVIQNYLMVHDSADDASMLQDIIDEFDNSLGTLNRGAEKANTTQRLQDVTNTVNTFSTQLQDTVKQKDKAIDDELTNATKAVDDLNAKITAIDSELTELREKLNKGNLGKIKDKITSAVSSTDKPGTGTGTGDEDEQAAIKEKIKQLEEQRAALEPKLSAAQDRKIRATTTYDARNNANTPQTIADVKTAHTHLLSYNSQSAKLQELHAALKQECENYQGLFKAKRDNPSPETTKALADHIQKVNSQKAKLKALQSALDV